jgi:hypothetical protein
LRFYLQLQTKRILRHLKDFGINPAVGIGLVGLFFLFSSYAIFSYTEYAPLLYVVLALSVVNSSASSIRFEMLKMAFSEFDYYKIRSLENLIVVFPFLAYMLFMQAFLSSILLVVVSLLLVFSEKSQSLNLKIPTPFSKTPFEFTIGFRKSILAYLFLYGITGIAVFVGNFNLGIFALFAMMLVCMMFYSIIEPDYYVWVFNNGAKDFLRTKMKEGVFNGLKSSLPIVIALIIFFPSNAWIVIGFLLLGQLYLIANLLLKYAYYPNNTEVYQAVLFPVLVLFPPLLLFIIPQYYHKSIENLNHITA